MSRLGTITEGGGVPTAPSPTVPFPTTNKDHCRGTAGSSTTAIPSFVDDYQYIMLGISPL